MHDVWYALRLSRRHPGFAVAVVATLALGVGATAAVFTLADPLFFRPLPYPESHRLVQVTARANASSRVMHVPDLLRLQARHGTLAAITAFGPATSVRGRLAGRAEEPLAYQVTDGFFNVIGVRPFLGREFLPQEYQVDAASDAAILTYPFWRAAFGGRPDIVNEAFDLGAGSRRRRFRVVGVMPETFVLPDAVNRPPDFLVGYVPDPRTAASPNRVIAPIARLAANASAEAAAADVQGVLRSIEEEYPQFARGRVARVRPLRESLFGGVRTPLLLLLGATAAVLLLACVNLTHLFLARLRARQVEFAVRLAIGADRWRVTRLLVVEAALFAIAGGVAALIVARWMSAVIMAATPEFAHVYRLLPARLDARIVLFSAALVGVALAAIVAVQCRRASRLDIRADFSRNARKRRVFGGDAGLIFVQCGVALILVVTGALLVRTFTKLAYQPLGFDPYAVRTVTIAIADEDPSRALHARRRIYDHLRVRLPVAVTVAGGLPAQTLPDALTAPDAPAPAPRPVAYPAAANVFDVFGVRLTHGRLYTEAEAFADAPVAVVDRRAADRLWPGLDPIGREAVDTNGSRRVVIGVVAALRTRLDDDSSDGTAFLPFSPRTRSMLLAMRDPGRIVSAEQLRAAVHEVTPAAEVDVREFEPFERTLGQPRFLALLLGTLDLLTIALSIVGIFGIVSHDVARRVREVGIRMAIGADPRRIRRLIVRGAAAPAALGVIAGAIVSLGWTKTLQSLLYGLDAHDVRTYAGSCAAILAVALVASAVPAWRASRLNPVEALRAD